MGPIKFSFRGLEDYSTTWKAMREFTDARTAVTPDEIWLLQHPPVFTQGQGGKPEHLLEAGNIPVVQSDRGGQITYHGPGQLIAYLLLDLRRLQLSPRQLVTRIEKVVIDLLAAYQIAARARPDAPGVYVGEAKICSLGLRIRKGCSYHGLALNVDMELAPFSQINPCGFKDLPVTQMRDLCPFIQMEAVQERLCQQLEVVFDLPIKK
jgi:lipoyl(octanoyl) transferase